MTTGTMALHKRLWTRDDLETSDIDLVDVGLVICGPLHHTRTTVLKNTAKDTSWYFLGLVLNVNRYLGVGKDTC